MYFVKYGEQYLHDPRNEGFMLLDLSLTCEQNSCGYCDFTIYPDHPLYDKIAEHDATNPIEVYDGDVLLFAGFIYELGKEFYLDGHVKCKGEMDYLNESVIRPFKMSVTLEEYFEWLIEQHNAQVDERRQFAVGVNQASWFSTKVHDLESDSYPKTIDEISDLFIGDDGVGGYLQIRHAKGTRYIDLLASWSSVNTQLLDFGVNLTDYTMTDDSEDLATFVIPTGAAMSETEYEYDDGYFETSDVNPVSGKEYYTKSYDYERCKNLTEFESTVTYYEYNDGYFSTSDTTPQSGKSYYTKSEYYSDEYDRFEGSTFIKAYYYYYEYNSDNVRYFVTSDVTPSQNKTYYTKEFTGYSKEKDTLIKFKPNVTYYEYDELRDETYDKLTIESLSDTTYHTEDFGKSNDHVYSKSAVRKYGMIGYSYSDSDITVKEDLLTAALFDLMNHISPYRTIEVKAVDMHLINPTIKPIRIGEYVRVRSTPHNLDSYFICRNIELDLNNPENSIYTLTTSYNRVYGEENSRINELNDMVDKEIESVEPIVEPIAPEPEPIIVKNYTLTLTGLDDYGWEIVPSGSSPENPDPTLYDGVYRSTNYNEENSNAVMRIDFTGYDTFNLYIRSYAESYYDYTLVSELDASEIPTDKDDAYASTYGDQQSGTDIESYTDVSFDTDGGHHFVYVVYRKDYSVDSGDDRGYLLIEK